MTQRSNLYDLLSALLVLGSLFFFYQSTSFLIGKDIIAAGLTAFIGLVVIKIGVELGKLAILVRRRERESSPR